MATKKVIEVPLPDGANPSNDDLDLLQTAFQALVALRYENGRAWERIERELAADGWTVRARLMWVAEASKGRDFEQAAGPTKDEAFAQLLELTRMDEVPEVP